MSSNNPNTKPSLSDRLADKWQSMTEAKRVLTVIGLVVAAFLILIIIVAVFVDVPEDSSASTKPSPTAQKDTAKKDAAKKAEKKKSAEKEAAKKKAAKEKAEKKKAEAKKKATPECKMVKGIKKVNQKAKVKVRSTSVQIRFSYKENATKGLARTGARIDTTDMLEAIAKSGWIKGHDDYGVIVEQYATLIDKLGNESKDRVVQLLYKGNTVEAINFKNFNTDNVWDIAASKTMHPAILN